MNTFTLVLTVGIPEDLSSINLDGVNKILKRGGIKIYKASPRKPGKKGVEAKAVLVG